MQRKLGILFLTGLLMACGSDKDDSAAVADDGAGDDGGSDDGGSDDGGTDDGGTDDGGTDDGGDDGGTGDAGDDGGDDGGDDDGGDDSADWPAFGQFIASNFLDGSVVADVEVVSSLTTTTTDSSGSAIVGVPADELYEVTLTHPSFFPVRWFGMSDTGDPDGFITEEFMVAPVVASGLASAFGTTIDESKGHVIASALTPVDGDDRLQEPLAGATLNLDVGFELAAAQDSSTSGGFAPGTTTADGGVVFMNVDTGAMNLSVTPPSGYSACRLFPYTSGDGMTEFAAEVSAGTVTRLTVTCLPE